MNEIKEIPVVRDEYGCWTHPEYENSVTVGNIFQRKSLTPGWRKIIFNTSSASEMKDVLTLMRVMLIFLHGNRNDQRAMDGLLVQYMTPKMARFVYG
ncbi:putative prophage protein [Escherichia coli]|nr:putative prophage protein [Escherichia coli]